MVPSVNFMGLWILALERVCMGWLLLGSGVAGTMELAVVGGATCWLLEQGTLLVSEGVGESCCEWDTGRGGEMTCGRGDTCGRGEACGDCMGGVLSGIGDVESGSRESSGIGWCIGESVDTGDV